MTGLEPDITRELIGGYFEAQNIGIVSVSVPEDGQAIVELKSDKGTQPGTVRGFGYSFKVYSSRRKSIRVCMCIV